jgi:hypothetical protein
MYSGEYDACDVTLSVYSHRASLKNMPDHEYITPRQNKSGRKLISKLELDRASAMHKYCDNHKSTVYFYNILNMKTCTPNLTVVYD